MTFDYLNIEGLYAAQLPQTPDIFKPIIKDYQLIIEIGTNRGGFALWLYQNKKETTELISLEINPAEIKIPTNHPIHQHIHIQNALDPQYIIKIKEKIQNTGKTLILCDGGNKIDEFKTYSQILKPQDTIMLHDYADSPNEEENYKKAKERAKCDWPSGPESNLAAIQKTIKEQNLEKYKYQEFLDILWGSFQKRG